MSTRLWPSPAPTGQPDAAPAGGAVRAAASPAIDPRRAPTRQERGLSDPLAFVVPNGRSRTTGEVLRHAVSARQEPPTAADLEAITMVHPASTVPTTGGSTTVYRFGDFELASSPLRLSRDDRPVILQPQPTRLLELLVKRPGEIVTRAEIRGQLWPDKTYLDHQQAINFGIRQIRIALGDDAKVPRFVETVPRIGYRFVAAVTRAAVEAPQPGAEAAAGESSTPRFDSGAGTPGKRSARPAARAAEPSGAISSSTCPGLRGLMRALPIAAVQLLILAMVVIGYASSEHRTPAAGVKHDLEARSPRQLSKHARSAYLQGRFLVEQSTHEQIRLGISKLRQVVADDPGFAPAHYALALGFYRQGLESQHFNSFMPEVEEKVTRALELDPGLPEAHLLLAEVLFVHRRHWDAAEAAVRRSLDLSGGESPDGLRLLAMILASRGRTAEAVALSRRAVELDPARLLVRSNLVLCLMYDRRYGEALEASRTNLEVAPLDQNNLFLDQINLFLDATLRAHLGDRNGALATFHSYFDTWGEPRPDSLAAAFDWLIALGEERRSQGRRGHLPLALLHALLDRPEAALEFLVEACDHDPHWELPMVGVDPRFDQVRALPGFADLEGCLPPIEARPGR